MTAGALFSAPHPTACLQWPFNSLLQLCRSLRKLENLQLHRLRVDIKDFQPKGVEGLNNGLTPWVATGKHLCGAATDFTLQCCASSKHSAASSYQQCPPGTCQPKLAANEVLAVKQSTEMASAGSSRVQQSPADNSSTAQQEARADSTPLPVSQSNQADKQVDGWGSRSSAAYSVQATSDSRDRLSGGGSGSSLAEPALQAASGSTPVLSATQSADTAGGGVQGLAVATCCHHRCTWQHYVGKPLFTRLGFSPDEFEVMSWMTGMFCLPLPVKVAHHNTRDAINSSNDVAVLKACGVLLHMCRCYVTTAVHAVQVCCSPLLTTADYCCTTADHC